MRWSIGAIFSVIAICCAGCASQPAQPIVSAVAPGQAKITIIRTDTGPISFLRRCKFPSMARILLISLLGKVTPAEPRGAVTLTLTQAGDIGHYNLEFNAVPG